MLLPVQDPLHCNQDEAEQSWHALIQEGKLVEIEPPGSGKFKTNTEEKISGGAK